MSSRLESSQLTRLDFGQWVKLLKSSKEDERVKACLALQRTNHKEARRIISVLALKDESPKVRQAAKRLLSLEVQKIDVGEIANLTAKSPRLRLQAAREIYRQGDKVHLSSIVRSLQCEGSPVVKAALVRTLGKLDGANQIRTLAKYSKEDDPRVRLSAINALLETHSQMAFTLVFQRFTDEDELVSQRAQEALTILGPEKTMALLTNMSKSNVAWLRETAALVLGFIDSDVSLEILEDFADDPIPAVREEALKSLRQLAQRGSDEARRIAELLSSKVQEAIPEESSLTVEELVEAPLRTLATDLASDNPFLRMKAVNAIVDRKDSEELHILIEHLINEENEYLISRIVTAIGMIGNREDDSLRSLLIDFLHHSDERIVANTIETAQKLGLTSLRPQIRPFIVSENSRLRANALLFLADCPTMDIARELSSMSLHIENAMHLSAIYAVECLAKERPGLVAQLTPISQSQSGPVHFALVEALERMSAKGNEQAGRLLRRTRGEGLGLSTVMPALRVERASYLKRVVAFCIDGFVTFWLFWIFFVIITTVTSIVAV